MTTRPVAYLSPEFGVDASLPQYSGGLGVLAGDHMKAAAEAGLPIVGVGLFYHHGYFVQAVDVDGQQSASSADLDPEALGLRASEAEISVDIAGTPVALRTWRADVNGAPLLLLDSDLEANAAPHRRITDRLYGGDAEHRLNQEVVLGIGGTRALEAMGIEPCLYHLNEGHAGFSALERLRSAMLGGLNLDEAVEAVRASSLFTTHTPVPAGMDRFSRAAMAAQFGAWCEELGLELDDLMGLGAEPGEPPGEAFNMACMALRLSGATNGVSRLHGAVSRSMFAGLWPDLAEKDVPIGHITNGVHGPTWTGPEMAGVLASSVGPDWPSADATRWQAARVIGDAEFWEARNAQRRRLVEMVRSRSGDAAGLDPDALTIGFARRFATYKRAQLLLGDPEALERLLGSDETPVQIIVAGKAHPADGPGQSMLAEVVRAGADPRIRGRLVFVEDYDMELAAAMVQGADLWLNNPLRPMEACGTSGMKAVYNGCLNCSVSDGWWDEMGGPEVGWTLRSFEELDRPDRDAAEAAAALEVLGDKVIPLFFERDDSGRPAAWLARARNALVSMGGQLSASRMVEDYNRRYYAAALQSSSGGGSA